MYMLNILAVQPFPMHALTGETAVFKHSRMLQATTRLPQALIGLLVLFLGGYT